MNNIGITLTADNKAMIKALQDAEKAMASMGKDMSDALKQVQAQANETGRAMANLGTPDTFRGMTQLNKQMGDLGMSAKATSAALRQVPAQFTDIIVSLQGGQAPLTVLLQQGGQLKDVFGGIGPAARALGGYVLGLVNPFTLAAAAAAVLGLAYKQGSDEADAFRKSLLLTGNASGATVGQLAGMAASMDETFGVTTGKAADALNAMAGTGRIARTSLQDFAQVAIDVEKSFGQSIQDTAKNFAELGKDPVGASKRLNESLNFLTAATYAQIKAAVDLGEIEKAAAIAQDAYAKAMKGRSDTVVQNLGYIERAYRASLSWAKEAWDAMLGFGRAETTTEKMADVRKELDLIDKGLRNVSPRQRASLEQQLAALQETEKLAKLAGDRQAERVAAEKAGIAAVDSAAEAAKKNREAREAAAKKAAEEAMRMIEDGVKLQQSLTAQDGGLSPEFAKQWDNLGKAYKVNKISLEQLLEAQRLLLDQQPFVKKAAKDREDAAKEMEAAAKREADGLKITNQLREDSLKPYEQSFKAQQKRVDALEQEEAALAMAEKMNVSLARAVEMVNIARMEEQITAARAAENFDAVEMLKREIEERKKLVELIGSKEARDASAKAAKQAATDWQKASDKIQDSITDALMRGFESGKGFAQNLRDVLVNMFKSMVLRPVISGVVSLSMGAASIGAPGMAAAQGANGINAASNAYQLGNTAFLLGSQMAAGTMSAANVGATIFGNSAAALYGDGLSAMLASNGAFGTAAGAGAAGGGSSIMASAAAAGPYVAAVVVALNALGVFRSNKTVGGGLMGTLGAGDIESYDLNRRGGTLFSGPSYSVQNVRQTEQTAALETAFVALRNSTAQMAKDLGLSTEQVNKFTMAVGDVKVHPDIDKLGLVLDGLSEPQKIEAINALLQKSADGMAAVVLGVGATAQQLAQIYATVMQERKGLELQLLQLQGDTIEIRKRERDALHDSNRALYDQIKALEDQKTAVQAAAEESRRLADLQRAAEEAAAQRQDALRSATDAAMAALQKSVNLEKAAAQKIANQRKASLDALGSVMGLLSGHISDLRQDVAPTFVQDVASANAGIDTAFALLKTGGVIPDQGLLSDQIGLVRKSIETDTYVTRAEANFARLDLANRLKALRDQAGEQLTQAEKDYRAQIDQVESLDKMLEAQQTQLDALRGIDTSVQSVTAAIAALQAAMFAESTGGGTGTGLGGNQSGAGKVVAGPFGPSRSTLEPGTVAQGFSRDYSGAEMEAIRANFLATQTDPAQLVKLMDQYGVTTKDLALSMGGDLRGYESLVNRSRGIQAAPAMDAAGWAATDEGQSAGGMLAVYDSINAFLATNPSSLALLAAMQEYGVSPELLAAAQANQFAAGGAFTNGIVTRPTAFDMGLMGEAGSEGILPLANVGGDLGVRAIIPDTRNSSMDEVVTELRHLRQENIALREELKAQRSEIVAVAVQVQDTSKTLARVTQGGDTMRVEVIT